jgi:hypothetical protein
VHAGFWWGTLRYRDHLEDLGLDRKIILNWIIKRWDRGMDWIELAQDKDKWRALANTVMDIRVP